MMISGFVLFLAGLIGGAFTTATGSSEGLFAGSSLITTILGGFLSFIAGAEIHLRTADR